MEGANTTSSVSGYEDAAIAELEQEARDAIANRVRPRPPTPALDTEETAREHHLQVIAALTDLREQRTDLNAEIKALVATENVLGRVVALFDKAHISPHTEDDDGER
jgi:hypothetical protein